MTAKAVKAQEIVYLVMGVAYLVMGVAEAGRGLKALKPEHGTQALFNRAMALLQQILRVAGRAMPDGCPEL